MSSTTGLRHRDGPLRTWARTRGARVVLPVILLAAFTAELLTREGPDYAIHAWVGIALVPIIAVHLSGNAAWITAVWKRGRRHREFGLGLLNACFAAVVVICLVTGFPPWLGWSEAGGWTATHTVTGFASILIMVVHLWRNRARISRLMRSRARRPPRQADPTALKKV